MKRKKVIGIIGEQAGGKGSAADIIIKRFGGDRLTTSNILRRTLESIHKDFSRDNLITLALSLKKNFGDSVLMEAMLKDVEKTDSDLIIVDGIRMKGDTLPFKEVYGDDFKLIYVTADSKLRYERSRVRGEKAGESDASFENFLEKEQAETERYISEVGNNSADAIIENNGSLEELEQKVLKTMESL